MARPVELLSGVTFGPRLVVRATLPPAYSNPLVRVPSYGMTLKAEAAQDGTTWKSVAPKNFSQAAIEAAHRAEATALLIRCGYRVYRPEADIEGEDLVLRLRNGRLVPVQLKPRMYVDGPRYSGLGLYMLFPIGSFTPSAPRPWFLVLHDQLFEEVKVRHGHTPGWTGRWHNGHPSKVLRDFVEPHRIAPPAEPEAHLDALPHSN